MTQPHLAIALVAVALALGLAYLQSRKRRSSNLPPGPTPHWLHGTPIPRDRPPWIYYYEQSRKYGPLVTFWNGPKPSVVCNDVESAQWFLEKNGRDTADRPAAMQAFSNGQRTLLLGHSDNWRRYRKSLHVPLQPKQAATLQPTQEVAARNVILDILESPDDFLDHFRTYAATLVVHMAYGREGRARYSDADIKKVVVCMERLGLFLRPGAFKVGQYPWLAHVPGYMSQFQRWADEEADLFRSQMRTVKSPSFGPDLIANREEYGLTEDNCAYILGSIFGAGSDTTAAALGVVVMAAACYPEQADEVRRTLPDHPPSWDDLEDLHLLKAFVNESYRWRPVSAGGFQHASTAEIAYKDFVIPKGTTITGNHWGIHRDEKYFGPDVEEFNVHRWKDGMRHFQFGFGRRVCPGQHVANNSVFINTALLLWAFDIEPAEEINTLGFTMTANMQPLPFRVKFTPRQENIRSKLEVEG